MPDARSSRAAAALVAALVGAAALGCARSVEMTPFRLEATSGGASALPSSPRAGIADLVAGQARWVGPGALEVTPAAGAAVTLAFDPSTGAAFPASLDGRQVEVRVAYDLDAVDAEGAPLPLRALRVSALGDPRFILGEGTLTAPDGLPAIAYPAAPEFPGEDVPLLEPVPGRVLFEPDRCGDQYYDVLVVGSSAGVDLFTLGRGERRAAAMLEGTEPWTVLHVLTWHRAGTGCAGRANSWIQAAAWR